MAAVMSLFRPLLASLVFACVLAPSTARAHFVLMQPPSFQMENAIGDPQKAGPCGGPGTATSMVTTYHAGDTVHFVFKEAIIHGGHYRVALGLKGQSDLPADPTVVQMGGW
jgi:hypothetical protein